MKMQKTDWLQLGLDVLVKEGAETLRIDNLCRMANATKGSFYHHFTNRDEFLDALLDFWQTQYSQQLIDAVAQVKGWQQRQQTLSDLIDEQVLKVERAMRRWALQSAKVTQVIAQTDKARLLYLCQQTEAILHEPMRSATLANIIYWHFIGCVIGGDTLSRADWKAMDDLLVEMSLALAAKE